MLVVSVKLPDFRKFLLVLLVKLPEAWKHQLNKVPGFRKFSLKLLVKLPGFRKFLLNIGFVLQLEGISL